MRPTTKHRLGRCVFGIGMSVALIATAGVPTSQAGEKGQFDSPWSFTARDRRVAIAVAIKQVEDGLLGPSRSTTNVENVVCNGPSGGASSSANFFCEVIRGDNNQIGDREQGSAGDQTATNNNSTNGNVNQSQSSGVDSVASALNGNF